MAEVIRPAALSDIKRGDRFRIFSIDGEVTAEVVIADISDDGRGTWTITPEPTA